MFRRKVTKIGDCAIRRNRIACGCLLGERWMRPRKSASGEITTGRGDAHLYMCGSVRGTDFSRPGASSDRPRGASGTDRSAASPSASAASTASPDRGLRPCSPSPPGPRTTSAATPTSTTRSSDCVPTRPRERTSSTRRVWPISSRSRPSAAPSNGRSTCSRTAASSSRRSLPPAQRISVGGALAWVAVEAMAASAEAMLARGDLSSLASMSRVRGWLDPGQTPAP